MQGMCTEPVTAQVMIVFFGFSIFVPRCAPGRAAR
jgi:hypothetical protein